MNQRQLVSVNRPEHRRSVWAFAAVVALVGHLGGAALAVAWIGNEPEDDDLGAPGIEVAFELASTQATPTDLPPGPESEAAAASAPVAPQERKVENADLPKETPVESEEPDRLVTTATSNKPDDDKPDVKPIMAAPSAASLPQEATAAPAIPNTPEAPKSTTRDQGVGESRQRARVTWQKELLAHLNKYKRYPAERSQKSAEILVSLTLDRTGHVLAANVARGSGDEAFDKAAISMVERANPVPAPPPLIADEGLDFQLPVVFRKNGK